MKLIFVLSASLFIAPAAGGATPRRVVPLDRVVASLVADLGAEPYALRERATEALRQIGPAALDALEKAAESDDPEIRLRAQDILGDVRLGIGPDWPSEIVLLIRHYDGLPEGERPGAIQRVAGALGTGAVPFLLARMGQGSDNEANVALSLLMRMDNNEARRAVLRLLKEPKDDRQARALAWARGQGWQALDALEAQARRLVQDEPTEKAVAASVQDLLGMLRERKAQDAADAAGKLAKAQPGEARFLYLEAEALAALDKDRQAAELRERALALNPDKEAPHYRAADLLGRLGRRRLAAPEWQRVLEIEPRDSLYDLNAYISLGTLYAASGLFAPAAEYLDKALARCVKAKTDGEQIAPKVGEANRRDSLPDFGTTDSLQREIGVLRDKAGRYPAPVDAALEDAPAEGEIGVDLQVTLKAGRLEDLQRALAGAATQLDVAVQPTGMNFFDIPSSSLRYDRDKKQLLVLLHDAPACEPFPFEAKAGDFEVAANAADCTIIFRVDAGGKAEKTVRFEKNYTVILRPGVRIGAWLDVSLQINGATCEWEKALKGIQMDRLPDELDIALEGTTAQGRRTSVRAAIKVTESLVKPIPPAP